MAKLGKRFYEQTERWSDGVSLPCAQVWIPVAVVGIATIAALVVVMILGRLAAA